MKAKRWGITAIITSIVMWALFAWAWLVVVGPNPSTWGCRDDVLKSFTVGPDGPYAVEFMDLGAFTLEGIVYLIIVFWIPVSIISLISNILLIKMKKAKTWGELSIIGSFGLLLMYMIVEPSVTTSWCVIANSARTVTGQSFLILAITSLISGVVLVKTSKRKTI